jgi:hypothetical protein
MTENLDSAHREGDGIVASALHPGGVRTELTVGCPWIWDYSTCSYMLVRWERGGRG